MWYSVILLHATVVAAWSTVWKHGERNVTQILLDKKVEVDVKSELVCALMALSEVPPVTYCYDGPKCLIARGDYKTNQSVGMDNWHCKFLPKCCAYPFTPLGVDCVTTVTVVTTNTPLPDSKVACIAMGAMLFSPDEPKKTLAMDAVLQALHGSGVYHWTDAMLVGGRWRWDGGAGRLIQPSEWGTSPTDQSRQCAYLRSGFGLAQSDCSSSWWPICVTPAPLCQ